jgi:hypothetical protein
VEHLTNGSLISPEYKINSITGLGGPKAPNIVDRVDLMSVPTAKPTAQPTAQPTAPTPVPSSSAPTSVPSSSSPSSKPSSRPTYAPSMSVLFKAKKRLFYDEQNFIQSSPVSFKEGETAPWIDVSSRACSFFLIEQMNSHSYTILFFRTRKMIIARSMPIIIWNIYIRMGILKVNCH